MFLERPFIINGFSSIHRAQFRFPFLPAGSCVTMAHLIENCLFCPFLDFRNVWITLLRTCTFRCIGIQTISASCVTFVCLTVDVTSAL